MIFLIKLWVACGGRATRGSSFTRERLSLLPKLGLAMPLAGLPDLFVLSFD